MSVDKNLTRILSLDGGGIRGIIPARILVCLEEKLKRLSKDPDARLAQFFDLIAGTSTGGILTCLYLAPPLEGQETYTRYSAQEALNLYMDHGDEIFDISWRQKIMSLGGVIDERYSAEALEKLLEQYFGDLQLKDALRPCLVSAYDVYESKAFFFTQQDARQKEGKNFYLREVARATTAAPTYFEAALVKSFSGVKYSLIDGGIFANNPSLCAYAEARQWWLGEHKYKPTAREMMILSLGNGASTKMSYPHKQVKNWGLVEWVKPLISMMMSGVEQTVHFQLTQIFEAADAVDQYLRIEPTIHRANPDIDDASDKNRKALLEAGTRTVEDEKIDEELERIARMLVANR